MNSGCFGFLPLKFGYTCGILKRCSAHNSAKGSLTMKKFRHSELYNAVLILLGLFLCTAAYNLFLIPNDIAAGGFTGIAQLVNKFTNWPVGTVALALNVPLFLFSMKSMGLKFGLRSLIATILLSVFLDTIQFGWTTNDRWLATLYGGLLSGIGFGLILRGNATTGGTDMLASVIHKLCPRIKVSIGLFFIDGLVVVMSAFVFDTAAAMYALIAILICNVVVDFVLEGPNSAHSFFIVSDKSDEIARRILYELDRGVTGLEGMGMYSMEKKRVLLCVVSRLETIPLRRIVFSVDPRAFLIASKSHDTYGEGFKEHK